MKKTLLTSCFLILLCTFGYSQKIVLVNGEAVKVKIDDKEIVEVVDDKVDNYMKGFEETDKEFFKKEEDIKVVKKVVARSPDLKDPKKKN